MLTGRVGRVLARQMVGLIHLLRLARAVGFTFLLRTMKDPLPDLTAEPKLWIELIMPDFPNLDGMTDRELLVETAVNMRNIIDAIEQLSASPMLAALMPGQRR